MSKKIVIGNWKMNPLSLKEAEKLFTNIVKDFSGIKKTEIVICPPFLYLEKLRKISKKVSIGGQDSFWADLGAYTGEISSEMLYNIGARYVILGHSERRVMGENNNDVSKKVKAAIASGLIPVVCVGESVRDENHEYLNFIKTQIEECLNGVSKNSISKIIIAYEPVWAIGSGAFPATPEEFREMNIFIRKILSDKFGVKIVENVRVIYGGSVDDKNAEGFIREGHADGFLPGRASLNPKKFSNCKNMRSIKQIKNLKDKVILLRAGFDVPIKEGKVVDSKRIEVLLPTIKYLIKKGPLVILSHQGRPNGKIDMNFTQKPLVPVLEKLLKQKIKFADRCIGVETEKIVKSLKKGEILLLENLRFEPGEEKNDITFAKELAKLGDVYVVDAFPDAHRKHASIVSVPKYLPNFAGFQFMKEVKYLSLVLEKAKHPFLLILGGAKFETKLPIIKRFLKTVDNIFIGGALVSQVLKEEGFETGISLVENKKYGLSSIIKNPKIILPIDLMVVDDKTKRISLFNGVLKKEDIVDIGPETIKELENKIKKAKMILWNGPLGESSAGFYEGTEKIIRSIAKTKATSIVGGGDTSEVISKLKLENKLTFVSTGGGAALDFLANGTLPGIKALQ